MIKLNTLSESKNKDGKVTHKIQSVGTLYVPTELDTNLAWKDVEIETVGASQDYRFEQSPNNAGAVRYMSELFAYDGTGEKPQQG